MKMYLLMAAAVALSNISLPKQCSESTSETEPELEASPVEREVTDEVAEAYRQQIEAAQWKDIGPLVMSAPNPELKAEARACQQKLRDGAETCVTE